MEDMPAWMQDTPVCFQDVIVWIQDVKTWIHDVIAWMHDVIVWTQDVQTVTLLFGRAHSSLNSGIRAIKERTQWSRAPPPPHLLHAIHIA